jgi:sirohydrochlorin ferrochelatase
MTLILVAHGTRDPAGARTIASLASLVAARLPVEVRVAYADVRAPDVTAVLSEVDGPAVVVPAFLSSGYHVRVDVPAQVARSGRDAVVTPAFGPAPELVSAAYSRLVAAGWRPGDEVVLAAAGSSDPRALAEVAQAARLLASRVGAPVRIGYATGSPRIDSVVARSRGRVAVASWLLAPGQFHRAAAASGAAVVAAPIGAHPAVADLVVARYRQHARHQQHALRTAARISLAGSPSW